MATKAVLSITVCFLLLSTFSYGFAPRSLLQSLSKTNGNYLTTKELWFTQTLDHYSPYDGRRFQQRYYEFLDNFRAPDGPIFLKLCGEVSCEGIPDDYTGVLAKKFGAAVVSPEHRYFGKSTPFKSLETRNLRYLSTKQALFDLAVFRQQYQEALNLKLNRTNVENPWIVFGISYAGALSAWFHLKFPHLTCGSVATSAVVLAVYNIPEFDQLVGESAGAECNAALQATTQLVETRLASNGTAVKALFNAEELEIDGDFMYFLADAAVLALQYGSPDRLCSPLVEAKKAGQDLVEVYAKHVAEFLIGTYGGHVQTYNQNRMKNTEVTENSSDRLWWFLACNEIAIFQVAPSNDSIRSSKLDLKYHLDLCKNVFGEGIFPKVDITNLYYGGSKIAGSKIVFTNGSQDPWRATSKLIPSPDLPSYLITCHNCGHGADMRGCPQWPSRPEGNAQNCSSPQAVQKVREQIIQHIGLWLSDCQASDRSYI